MSTRLGIVIVSYDNGEDIAKLVENIRPQLRTGDKLIIVDNKKPYQLTKFLDSSGIKADIIKHDNGGFGAGCNVGAAAVQDQVDVLLFLNPDTYTEQSDYLDRMRRGYGEFDAWQSLLLLPNGRINSYGNNVHITGLTWSDRFGLQPPQERLHRLIHNLSGACLAIDVQWWQRIGGFTEAYFMYFEDVDLSTKLLITGAKLGILEDAELRHNYDFEKGTHKWLYLERNRQLFMLINWPARLLILTLIPNLLFNVVIFLQYLAKGRGLLKLKADWLFLKSIPLGLRLRRERRALWKITPKAYFHTIGYAMNTNLLGKITDNKVVFTVMWLYYRVVGLFFI